jgi:acetolactate synthase-1/2/3 large subunit
MKASELLVRALENEGVEYIFGIPGEENLLFLAALRDSRIKLVLTRHEQAAGFMAATYGRLTGRPGVCLSTLGPGATNLVTAAAYAQLGGMPLLMITGQKPIKSSKQGRFQILDVVEMMRPLTKYTRQIIDGHRIPAMVREAVRVSMEERPGAVHLELPEDVAAEESNEDCISPAESLRSWPNADSLKRAAEMIKHARAPLLLVGAGANRKQVADALRQFVDKLGIPFFTTQMGIGVLDSSHYLSLGTAALSNRDFVHNAVSKSDLIINVGHDVIEKPPFFMDKGGPTVIHINFTSAEVDEIYFPQIELIADVGETVLQLTNMLEVSEHWNFKCFTDVKRLTDELIASESRSQSFPVHPQRLVADVRAALPSDGIVALDNGMYKLWFARLYKAHLPNTLLLDNALASMGAGLPSAMAAKLVYPQRKVVAVCGDGGFMMNSQELETAIRLGLDLVVVVLNDGGYGMIKWKQAALNLTPFGLDFGNPDFVRYAQAYDAIGHRIHSTEQFLPTLQGALEAGGLHLIDLPVDYSENANFGINAFDLESCEIS